MVINQRLFSASIISRHVHQIRKRFVSPVRYRSTLPGGFTKQGLLQWCLITEFGADGYQNLTSQVLRRRRRQLELMDDYAQPYTDLFSKRVSSECNEYLWAHHSPSDVLGRAFFGSTNFAGERMVLSSLNSMLSLYPEENNAATLPDKFNLGDTYLQWKVTMKAPLELICSWNVEKLNIKGCTMMAFDPSLRYVYHGNCIDMANDKLRGELPQMGIKMHEKYANFLLDGMVHELESIATKKD